MTQKEEFCSPAWIALARDYLTTTIPPLGDTLVGVTFSACEVFTDPPTHLVQQDNEVAWHFVIDGPKVEVDSGQIDGADWAVKADYTVALPSARFVYADNPEAAAAAREAAKEAAAKGEPPPGPTLPKELSVALRGLHDHMARLTR